MKMWSEDVFEMNVSHSIFDILLNNLDLLDS